MPFFEPKMTFHDRFDTFHDKPIDFWKKSEYTIGESRYEVSPGILK